MTSVSNCLLCYVFVNFIFYFINLNRVHFFCAEIILNAKNPEFRWNYEGNSALECHVLYVYEIICSEETENSEVKYDVEKRDVTLVTFANL